MLNIVLFEPEIPANTRKHREDVCGNKHTPASDRTAWIPTK